jgi:hypothetical protein
LDTSRKSKNISVEAYDSDEYSIDESSTSEEPKNDSQNIENENESSSLSKFSRRTKSEIHNVSMKFSNSNINNIIMDLKKLRSKVTHLKYLF